MLLVTMIQDLGDAYIAIREALNKPDKNKTLKDNVKLFLEQNDQDNEQNNWGFSYQENLASFRKDYPALDEYLVKDNGLDGVIELIAKNNPEQKLAIANLKVIADDPKIQRFLQNCVNDLRAQYVLKNLAREGNLMPDDLATKENVDRIFEIMRQNILKKAINPFIN